VDDDDPEDCGVSDRSTSTSMKKARAAFSTSAP
jgi:hypothetical protein